MSSCIKRGQPTLTGHLNSFWANSIKYHKEITSLDITDTAKINSELFAPCPLSPPLNKFLLLTDVGTVENFNKTSITTIGSIYTRWGRKSCDGDSSLVYEGKFRCILLTEQCQLNPSILAHSYFQLSNWKANVKYP